MVLPRARRCARMRNSQKTMLSNANRYLTYTQKCVGSLEEINDYIFKQNIVVE